MTLESCDTVHVAKRSRELVPGLWAGDRNHYRGTQGKSPTSLMIIPSSSTYTLLLTEATLCRLLVFVSLRDRLFVILRHHCGIMYSIPHFIVIMYSIPHFIVHNKFNVVPSKIFISLQRAASQLSRLGGISLLPLLLLLAGDFTVWLLYGLGTLQLLTAFGSCLGF